MSKGLIVGLILSIISSFPMSTGAQIFDPAALNIDPKTATMVAFAVAAALAAGTGVGSPLAPVILGGGAALASQ